MHCVFACAGLLRAIPAATPTVADEAADLVQELANPLAEIIAVPFQLNYGDNLGLADDRSRDTLNIQPVVAFQLGDGPNLITRSIIPFVWQHDVVPCTSQSGCSDVLVSAWFSPLTARDLTCSIRPVARFPIFSDVSSDTWAAGITDIALRQSGPWTYGALPNHLWDLEDDPATPTNATFFEPFVAYSTDGGWAYSLQTESTYDWETEDCSVPVYASVSRSVQWRALSANSPAVSDTVLKRLTQTPKASVFACKPNSCSNTVDDARWKETDVATDRNERPK
ncbi:MAG: transporter [Rhodobacteraceae bacterium]|nr:transporter [Paracoccaceae bacterium]